MSKLSVIKRPANAIPRWPFTINRQSEQARGLVAWYPMGLPGGNGLVNQIGSLAGLGTIVGCNWTGAPDSIASALSTPGTASNCVDAGTESGFDGDNFTIHVWWRAYNSAAFGMRFVCYYGPAIWYLNGFGIDQWGLVHGSTIDMLFGPASGAKAMPFDTWMFTTVTKQGSATAAYLNGLQIASGSTSTFSKTGSIYLGRGETGFEEYSKADYRDVRFYSRPLSAPEVWALYDPATRYELYQPLHSRNYLKAAAANVTRTSDFNITIGAV